MSEPNIVIVAGGSAIHLGAATHIREIADRTNIGVLNTWVAKGLFPWNHPAHLGTMGLQADDIELAGLAGFDEVVLCGVSNDELGRDLLAAAGVRWRDIEPIDIGIERLPTRMTPTPRPALYDRLAAACSPMYADETLPLNPARAASDLAELLPDHGVVAADASRSGFWIGRTFPTRTLGSVQLPTRATPGFAATQAAMTRRLNRFSVAIVDHLDPATESVASRATDLLIEVWTDGGPMLSSDERSARIRAAHAAGGVHVMELGVRLGDIDVLTAVAGAPLWHS